MENTGRVNRRGHWTTINGPVPPCPEVTRQATEKLSLRQEQGDHVVCEAPAEFGRSNPTLWDPQPPLPGSRLQLRLDRHGRQAGTRLEIGQAEALDQSQG